MRFVLYIICGLAFTTSVLAEQKKETPTRIKSDVIDVKRSSQTVNFISNVVVQKDDNSMLADKMTVIYEEKTQPKKPKEKVLVKTKGKPENILESEETSVKQIDAEGHVRVFGDDLVATGKTGHYNPKEEIFVLEENVVVNRGTSSAQGDKFIYNLKTKKGQFIGENTEKPATQDTDKTDKRVTVVIGDDAQDSNNKKSKPKNDDKNSQR